jgi:hypothetical protein
MVVAVLVVVLAGAVLVACLQHAKAQGWTSPGMRALREAGRRRLPAPPPEDMPPPNLTPLIPSPRVIATEFERGLRELTFYLAVQTGE